MSTPHTHTRKQQVLADVFDCEVLVADSSDAAAMGAALRAEHGLKCRKYVHCGVDLDKSAFTCVRAWTRFALETLPFFRFLITQITAMFYTHTYHHTETAPGCLSMPLSRRA